MYTILCPIFFLFFPCHTRKKKDFRWNCKTFYFTSMQWILIEFPWSFLLANQVKSVMCMVYIVWEKSRLFDPAAICWKIFMHFIFIGYLQIWSVFKIYFSHAFFSRNFLILAKNGLKSRYIRLSCTVTLNIFIYSTRICNRSQPILLKRQKCFPLNISSWCERTDPVFHVVMFKL